jgi:phosphoglycerate dehydrogenase-like enzyme
MSPERPVLVHARWPYVTEDLVTPAHHDRLDSLCTVPTREPITDFKDDAHRALLAEAEILLTSWGAPRLGSTALARLPKLRYVAHAAGTVKDLVTDHVWERDIRVSSAAGANALPVAEYTVAAVLFSGKQVFRLQQHYRQRRDWQRWSDVAPGLGNHGKTIGIVGASRIGRRVLELLRPFDFRLLVADPTISDADAAALGARLVELDDLARSADIVSLHAPSLPGTHHLFDARRLALLRDGAVLINTARGALVDHAALTAELVSGRIDAVLDVTDPEVLPGDSPLYELPNVFLTPHIAGSQGTETQRMTDLAVAEIERYVTGSPLQHEVTRDDLAIVA